MRIIMIMPTKIAQNIQTDDCATLFRISKNTTNFRYKFDEYSSENTIFEDIKSNEKGNLIKFQISQKNFEKIPGSPIAYWVSDKFRGIFKNKFLYEYAIPRAGMITGNNDIFLRLWNEVSFNKIGINCKSIEESISSKRKWFPYQKD